MADHQVGNVHGLPIVDVGDEDSVTNLSGTNDPQVGFNDTDLLSIAAMRARLATIDAGLYTAEFLNSMTYNDMVYAIRVNDNPDTLN